MVARFTLVVPDLCHDTHSCPVSVGDHWLAGWLPRVLRTRAYRAGATAVIVTWDEDDRTAAQHIPTLVVAPSVRPGTRSRRRFNHYSMLRTTERLLRLRYLGHARRARGMAAAFHLAR